MPVRCECCGKVFIRPSHRKQVSGQDGHGYRKLEKPEYTVSASEQGSSQVAGLLPWAGLPCVHVNQGPVERGHRLKDYDLA